MNAPIDVVKRRTETMTLDIMLTKHIRQVQLQGASRRDASDEGGQYRQSPNG